MEPKLHFRYAERKDTPLILRFIRELADYEKMLNEVVADEATLEEWIFDKEKAEVIFACLEEKEIGFALFFHNFSTFLGRAGLYLEDLYVSPRYRGHGYGKAILKQLAKIAAERKCGRLEWWCLDWNKPSIDFIFPWGQSPCPTGPCTGSPAKRCKNLRNKAQPPVCRQVKNCRRFFWQLPQANTQALPDDSHPAEPYKTKKKEKRFHHPVRRDFL